MSRICVTFILCLCACATLAKQPTVLRLLDLGKGINTPEPYHAENVDPANHNEFLEYNRAFTRVGDLVRFAIPPEDTPTRYRYTGIGPFPVKAMHRYALAFQMSKRHQEIETYTAIFCATFLQNGKPILFNPLYGTGEPLASITRIEQDFATPPGADGMILWVGVYNSPHLLQPGPKLLFKSLELLHRGPMNGAKDNLALRNMNLLPVSNFEDAPSAPMPRRIPSSIARRR